MSAAEDPRVNPWVPMSRPLDLKHLGKLAEELGEAAAAVARCIIQGIDEAEPLTGKPNRQWLEEELADVHATLWLVVRHFSLDPDRLIDRAADKSVRLMRWHAMPGPGDGS